MSDSPKTEVVNRPKQMSRAQWIENRLRDLGAEVAYCLNVTQILEDIREEYDGDITAAIIALDARGEMITEEAKKLCDEIGRDKIDVPAIGDMAFTARFLNQKKSKIVGLDGQPMPAGEQPEDPEQPN